MGDNQQSLIGDKRYIVSLGFFEGPLDLLLHLIKKHELDIFNIPMSFITKKYLEYLDMMKQLNLNLAAEYLEMAVQLTLIKSKMMLPNESEGDDDDILEEGPDPREELVRQLLDYQKYKTAADTLLERPMEKRDIFVKPDTDGQFDVEQEIESPGLFNLMKALKQVFERLDLEENPKHSEIEVERVSVTARIHQVLEILLEKKRVPFITLFEGQKNKFNVVISFLAILEMTKLGLAKVHQVGPETEIHISVSADRAKAERVLSDHKVEE